MGVKRATLRIVIITTILCLVSTTATYAAEPVQIVQKFADIYKILRGIGLAGATISLGVTGFMQVSGNEQAALKARTASIYICVAVAAMYLIPKFVGMGVQWGKTHAWSPR